MVPCDSRTITIATSVIISSDAGLRPLLERTVSDSVSSNFLIIPFKALNNKALSGSFFRVLSSRGEKNEDNAALLIMRVSEDTRQIALETIHGVPHSVLKIYTDGRLGDGSISGSSVHIVIPDGTFDIKIMNINCCSGFSCQVIYSQFGLAIHQNDHQARRRFVEWVQNEIAVVPDFHNRILFSDEAHFWLNGYVNKQNCRIWSEANPQVYVETPLHPEKLTVWCALWAGGIIGPYFFKNDEGNNVTVNGDLARARYRAMITNFFIPELNNHDVQELWFQQDGATCHTARATIDLLKDTFGDRLISRFGPVNWPPRSCDLTPLDYFLWGYVKSLVYADKPQTLDHLEDNIRRVIADIRPQMLEKVIENWTSRLDYIRASRGSPMPEIIFKM
ncbi:putative DD41D transposase [Trichonephila clavipes]|uniref:Putative DD41D transposase n=1 Tax=Trichonephila clavipes TaxID=2585209 RepID=A0A8X6W0Q3_TRICX|nr:putative DD41D transposase [Trichonephila clavipes]